MNRELLLNSVNHIDYDVKFKKTIKLLTDERRIKINSSNLFCCTHAINIALDFYELGNADVINYDDLEENFVFSDSVSENLNKIYNKNLDYVSLPSIFSEDELLTDQFLEIANAIILEQENQVDPVEVFNLVKWLCSSLLKPIYSAGYPSSQEEYEHNYEIVFSTLEIIENKLSNNRYLTGNKLTFADIFLYSILIRFDVAFFMLYKLNKQLIRDYSNLSKYMRDLYQTESFGNSTNFDLIKKCYYFNLSPYYFEEGDANAPSQPVRKLPLGPDEDFWLKPHGRDLFI